MRNYLILLFFLCSYAKANDVKNLAQKSGCLACHSVDRKVLGPAFSQVAAKYKDDPNSLTTLVNKVKNGGSGVWGPMPMPSNKHISDENITTIVNWIITGIQPSSEPLPTTTTASSTNSNSTAGKTIIKGLAAAVGIYAGVQEAKSNSRSRNAQVSQTVPQIETRTNTQTSQNNYPSSDSSSGDYNSSDSNVVESTERRPDNPAALVNQCISIKPGGGGLKNNCGFTIYYTYCTLNSIHNMVNKCEQNRLGGSGMGPYKDDGYSSLAGDAINWFACKAPSLPKQTNYDPQQGVITGYCSN